MHFPQLDFNSEKVKNNLLILFIDKDSNIEESYGFQINFLALILSLFLFNRISPQYNYIPQ